MRYTRTISISFLAVLAVLSIAACQDAEPLAPTSSTAVAPNLARLEARRGEPAPVPYVGTLLTTASIPAPPPPGCQLFLNTAQEGEATHLGSYTGTGTTCGFNGQMGVTDPPFTPAGGPPYFVSDFVIEQTHIAADGDQLWISGEGVFVQSLADGSSAIVGSGTIEGGTGRFAGATGAFDIEGVSGMADRFEGWIAFDASNRASLP